MKAVPEGAWVLGVDIGGTSVSVGLVPAAGGDPVALRNRATRSLGEPAEALERIVDMAREVVADAGSDGEAPPQVLGVGIGCPGPLDMEAGVVLDAFNLGWRDLPVRSRIADPLGLPAYLDNDARCATYGEWWQGAGKPYRSVVGVTLGTGIGGGLIVDGDLLRGASGTAGELGHMTIEFSGRRCSCGNYGCLEAYASGPNIAARAREGVEAGAESSILDLVDGDPSRITALTVYEALRSGDRYAAEVMTETAKILGAGIATLVNVVNPEAVVIVGGVTRAGDHLFEPLRAEVRKRAFKTAEKACRILPGSLPDTAGVIGAAGLFVKHGAWRA